MALHFTPESVSDLKRLRAFIAERNPEVAQRVACELLAGIQQIEAHPNMGRKVEKAPVPEMIRDRSIGVYIVRYAIIEKEIHFLRVWHRRENWSD